MASAIQQAKDRVKSEKTKVKTALDSIIGSRTALAVLSAAVIAFGSHVVFAPFRAAPIFDNFSFLTLGLPPLDFGLLGQGVRDASEAALRQGAAEEAQALAESHSMLTPTLNVIGLVVAALLLAWNFKVLIDRRRAEALASA